MTTPTFYTRQMLMQYGRQLVTARRLARYDQLLGRGRQIPSDTAEQQRRQTVERVAREIMENLIFSGSENPIVREVHARLREETGQDYVFRYPPADQDFQIFCIDSGGYERELRDGEKQAVMARLWDVTLQTVDATML